MTSIRLSCDAQLSPRTQRDAELTGMASVSWDPRQGVEGVETTAMNEHTYVCK